MSGSRKRQAVPTVLAVLVLAWAAPHAWRGETPITDACEGRVPAPDERAISDSRASVWPPGVRCTVQLADGRRFEATYITWYELMTAGLLAAGVWLMCAALVSVIPPRHAVYGLLIATAAFIAASAVFFL